MNMEEKRADNLNREEVFGEESTPIKLVEVKAPQMPREITFPKEISFSQPIGGMQNQENYQNIKFKDEGDCKEVQERPSQPDRWAEYMTPQSKKRNWVPICIAGAVFVGLLVGLGSTFLSLHLTGEEQMSAEVVTQVWEPIETVESVEEIVPEESTETEENVTETESSDVTEESAESFVAPTFIENQEEIGYGVTYDAQRAEEMLDALSGLYEQMPQNVDLN